jgi:MOSC domain-containing protein YiiM
MILGELQNTYYKAGCVDRISVRPERLKPVIILETVEALKDVGLRGDHYQNRAGGRQVTLIQAEHLHVIAMLLDSPDVSLETTRRNIEVSGINLLSLKGKRFRIGTAIFEYSGECHPCSRMEKSLGTGGYNAMRGHGGITARVIQSGYIRASDKVEVENDHPSIKS